MYHKEKYVVHIRILNQTLNHGLVLKKGYKMIKSHQKTWLKPYINMNTRLRIESKDGFEKDFCKLMNYSVLGKAMEKVKKHRDIRLVTTD